MEPSLIERTKNYHTYDLLNRQSIANEWAKLLGQHETTLDALLVVDKDWFKDLLDRVISGLKYHTKQ